MLPVAAYDEISEEKLMAILVRSDADIRADVIDEIDDDPAVTVNDIAVIVEGGIVTLTGVADSYGTRRAAENAAWWVCGVRDVVNQIVVDPTLLGVPTDAELAADVQKRLEHNFLLPKDRIRVSVHDGVVTLAGSVDWHLQREAARESAAGAKGVRDINDEIEIDRSRAEPGQIQASIKKALIRRAQVDAGDIHVAVDGGHVTLSGTARSAAERQDAVDAAWRVRGVTQVNDNITIEPFLKGFGPSAGRPQVLPAHGGKR
jgi:osmotically-inducible protein OsmY